MADKPTDEANPVAVVMVSHHISQSIRGALPLVALAIMPIILAVAMACVADDPGAVMVATQLGIWIGVAVTSFFFANRKQRRERVLLNFSI